MARRSWKFPWRTLLYSIALIASVTGLVLLLDLVQVKSSEQACLEMRIDIIGQDAFVEHRDIAQLIDMEYGQLVGRTLASIPTHDMESTLAKIPYVARAQVSTDMNGTLYVQIWQRRAVLRITDELGEGYYVDQEGVKLPISMAYAANVPVANGFIAEKYGQALDRVETDLVKGLRYLAEYITHDPVWEQQIAQIYVNEEGDVELVPRSGRHRIILGNTADLDEKFRKLMVYYHGVVPKTGVDAYDIVNLKYKDQLVCVQATDLVNRDSLENNSMNFLNIQ